MINSLIIAALAYSIRSQRTEFTEIYHLTVSHLFNVLRICLLKQKRGPYEKQLRTKSTEAIQPFYIHKNSLLEIIINLSKFVTLLISLLHQYK